MDAHTKPMFSMFLLLSGALMVVILYYYAYPMWAGLGLRSRFMDSLMLTLYRSGSFRNPYAVRGVCLFFCAIAVVVRSGRSQNAHCRITGTPSSNAKSSWKISTASISL